MCREDKTGSKNAKLTMVLEIDERMQNLRQQEDETNIRSPWEVTFILLYHASSWDGRGVQMFERKLQC